MITMVGSPEIWVSVIYLDINQILKLEVYGWSIVIHTINLGESFVYPHNQ
jgi:hypothetical protein